MRNKKRLIRNVLLRFTIFYFLSILGNIYNNSDCFAESVMIAGSLDSLIILANTEYLDNKPVLIYAEQLSDRKTAIALLESVDNFVFQNSIWEDLAIDFSFYAVTVKNEFPVYIHSKGVFELWADSSFDETNWVENKKYSISIDGRNVINDSRLVASKRKRKYVKIGEVFLDRGNHSFSILFDNVFLKTESLRLFLVNREERLAVEAMIETKISKKNVNSTYIFERDEAEFWLH